MSLEAIYFISQIGAAVAVACSLVFVAMQLRQSEKTQRAMMHQAIADRNQQALANLYSKENSRIFAKMFSAARELEPFESFMVLGLLRITVSNLDDAFWQVKNGLVSETVVKGMVASARGLFASPGARVALEITKDVFPEEHLRIVNDILLRDAPVEHIPSIAEVWYTTYDRLFANPADASASGEVS